MSPGGGLLVTLDGPSGVGKTTVSGLIRDRLAAAGVPVVLTTTPSPSSLGELARHGTNQFFGAALTCDPQSKGQSIMKVALVYPEVYDMARFKEHRKEFPPFGVLYLAAVIEQAGHDVTIKKITPRATCLELRDYDAVGFSLASSATYGFMREARDHSAIREDALIMVGGVHCNFYPLDTIKDFRAHVATDGESDPNPRVAGRHGPGDDDRCPSDLR